MTRVALYARVSTNDQNIEMQLGEQREFCKHRGWQAVAEYADTGVSGSKDSRPALNRLMHDVKQCKCDVVLVWKLDRFGRSLTHLVTTLAEFEALGVSFVSVRDNLDLTTPSGRLMFHVIASMAEFERELIRERVKAGMRHAKAKGVNCGRPVRIVDADAIARLQADGLSMVDIAEKLGVSVGTVFNRVRKAKVMLEAA